jgi:hypothetical protein
MTYLREMFSDPWGALFAGAAVVWFLTSLLLRSQLLMSFGFFLLSCASVVAAGYRAWKREVLKRRTKNDS